MPKPPVLEVDIADDSWEPNATKQINARGDVVIRVTGAGAAAIVQRAINAAHAVTNMDMFKHAIATLPNYVPGVKALPIDPVVVVPVLAAIGALGGAIGTVGYVGAVAVAHQYHVAVSYDLGSLFDPTDDSVKIVLTAP